MSQFLLLFGNTPELSRLEFESLYPDLLLTFYTPQLVGFNVEMTPDQEANLVEKLKHQLGGIIKIFKVVHQWESSITDRDLLAELVTFFQQKGGKAYFSLNQLGKQQRDLASETLKDALQAAGISARYFTGSIEASALLLHHKQATELLLFNQPEQQRLLLAMTVAVQDIDLWTKKDRSKPYADRKKGMLPPKVALMMTNIALGSWRQSHDSESLPLLYDPFCGTGTVLLEAALLGLPIIGSDLDDSAVKGSQMNLAWLEKAFSLKTQNQIFLADVGRLPLERFSQKVELVVTEPFLGRQTPREVELANIFRGLEKMYLGAFNNFSKILAPGARICIVFPKANIGKHQYSLQGLIDKLSGKGYNLMVKPVLYAREGAQIQREICLFEYTPTK